MLIRAYSPDDAEATAQLFRETISEVCKDDYAPGQLRAWTSGCGDLGAWNAFSGHITSVFTVDAILSGS